MARKRSAASSAKGQPKPAKQPPGLLSKTLYEALAAAPSGTPDRAIVMQALRSMSPQRLKAALAEASPQVRHQLFSAIPGDQIKSVLEALPADVLAPAAPPPAAPSPHGGPPASILQTTYTNMDYPPAATDANWAHDLSGGTTVKDLTSNTMEWVPVYDPSSEKEGALNRPAVGLTGWVVTPSLSQGDVWFTHPFGFDWEFYVVPDPQFESLLAPSNTGVTPGSGAIDSDYNNATTHARTVLGLPAPKGVLGVEIDQDLVPTGFRNAVTDGARIATFGRWIVDCGHPDFHTEIHPPLLTAVAKPVTRPPGVAGGAQMTSVQIMSRPYTVSQRFAEGNFVHHLLAEVGKVETTVFGIPLSWRVEAHPSVFTTPYEGRPYIKLLIKPPVPRDPIRAQVLTVSYHFTHRHGVAVQVFDAGNDTVGVIIVLGDLNPAPLPPKHDLTVQWGDLGSEYSWIIDALQIADILTLQVLSAIILNRGILTDRYDAPSAASPLDNQNVAAGVSVNQLQAWAGQSEDDTQPFPIYGWLNVWWQNVGTVNA